MKAIIKTFVLTVLLVGCKKSFEPTQKPLPKNYQFGLMRVQAVDNDNVGTTNSQVVFITIEK